jgi:hypothetical protein
VKERLQKDIAKDTKVSESKVSTLKKSYELDSGLLDMLDQRELDKESLKETLIEVCNAMEKEKYLLRNMKKLQLLATAFLPNKSTKLNVSEILKKDCLMSYKKISMSSYDINSKVLKYKRHWYSKIFVKSLQNKLRVLNYDETWFNQWSFANKVWSRRGIKNV